MGADRKLSPMWTRQHKRRNTGRLIVPAIAVLFLTYFGFHAWHGKYGILSKYQLEMRIAELEDELDGLHRKRGELEHRVGLLRDGTLERDMLDEQARRTLNVANDNEIVIFREQAGKN